MKIKLTTLEDTRKSVIAQRINTLEKEKEKFAECGDENRANNCWRELNVLELNVLYIQAFYNIKNKNYRDAWYQLEQCEIKIKYLIENSTEEYLNKTRSAFIQDKVSKWQSLYPYCVFCSPGFIIGYHTCSICEQKVRPRSRCGHKKGRIYNGELCLHVAHDLQFLELSIVSKPVQKYSVMHNDETLDFTLLRCLSDILENPFEHWDLNRTKKTFLEKYFENVKNEDKCPCQSGSQFQFCCKGKGEIEIPHIDFIFSRPLPNVKETIKLPY